MGRLKDLVAEHLEHLHYLNDILCLDISSLNAVLTDHLLNRLFIPLYVYSLTAKADNPGGGSQGATTKRQRRAGSSSSSKEGKETGEKSKKSLKVSHG